MDQLKKLLQQFLAIFNHHSSETYQQGGLQVTKKNGLFKIGLTDQILEEVGEISFIKSPDLNDQISQGDQLLDVEGGKVVETFPAPTNGKIVALNSAIIDHPNNLSAQSQQWLVTIKSN